MKNPQLSTKDYLIHKKRRRMVELAVSKPLVPFEAAWAAACAAAWAAAAAGNIRSGELSSGF